MADEYDDLLPETARDWPRQFLESQNRPSVLADEDVYIVTNDVVFTGGGGSGGDSGSVSGDNHANEMPVSLCGTNGLDVATAEGKGVSVVGYLSLAGIDGESLDPDHESWIEILHIKASWDSEDPDAIDEFDSDEREPVVPQQFTFKHIDDDTTTRLAIAEKNGTVIEWGYLNVCKPTGDQPVVTSTMIFSGIKIVKLKVTQEEISEGIVEFVDTVKIYADKFTWSVDGAVTRTVTIGDHPHLTAAYTSGRGTVTNAIDGASFSATAGAKHVKVIFTAEPGWEIIGDAVVEIDTVVKDIVFGEEGGYKVPKVVSDHPSISPGEPLGPFVTAQEATNMSKRAVFAPSAEVEAKLVKGSDALKTYCYMFGLDVVPTSDGKWAVAAGLKPQAWTNVVLSAHAATRQIPVEEIAAMTEEGKKVVTVEGCVPGFYYTLYGAAGVRALPMGGALPTMEATAYGPVLCEPDKPVTFEAVEKPSETAGFFSIEARAVRE